MFHTHKKTSLGRSTRQKERGWVTILHPGWSAPTCGKTQYLHFAIRTSFFSLYFPQHRLHTSLECGMLLYECWSVMACTCLLVTKWNAIDKLLVRLLPQFLFISARRAALQWHIICVWLRSYLWAYFVPNWKDILCLTLVATLWHWQVCKLGTILKTDETDEQWLKQMHNLSSQYLFSADVADKSLCLSSVSV